MIRDSLFLYQDYARQYGMRRAMRRSLHKLFGCFPSEATEVGRRGPGQGSGDAAAALTGRLVRTFGTDFWQLVARK